MVVRLRFARPLGHTRRTTWFDLVATIPRKARDAKPIEKLGEYDPVPRISGIGPGAGTPGKGEKRVEWSEERIRYWLGVGAQPTKSVAALLERGGLLPAGKVFKGTVASRMLESSRLASPPSTPTTSSPPTEPTPSQTP